MHGQMSPEVVPDVQAIWELLCANRDAILGYKLLTGAVLNVATDSPGYSCEAERWRCGSALLVIHHTKTLFCVAAWRKKACNAPKRHSSHLYRAGLFVPVVARPIQNMSQVSITHKTMGIRLPRLWCGARVGYGSRYSEQTSR